MTQVDLDREMTIANQFRQPLVLRPREIALEHVVEQFGFCTASGESSPMARRLAGLM